MKWIRNLLPLSIVLSMMVPVYVGAVGSDDMAFNDAPPTRAYFQESEPNDQWSAANTIPVQTGSSIELHGNLSGGGDFDHFYVNLKGGAGPVDKLEITPNYVNASDQNDMFLAWCWGFVSEEVENPSMDEVSLAVDLWSPDPMWWSTISFHASYTGKYGIIVRPYDSLSGNLRYNLTITVSAVSPSDSHNDRSSAKELSAGNSLLTDSMTTDQDLFDWYHITAPHDIHPTKADITFSLTSFSPNSNDGTYDWGVELEIFFLYNSRGAPSTFSKTEYRVSSSSRPNFISDGCTASPFQLKTEKNCTEMYIGILIRSYGVTSNGQRSYSTGRGSASYSMDCSIEANIPNKRPVLWDSRVEPDRGRTSDIFRFSVTYFDPQNESAKYVELWLDGDFFRELQPVSLESYDYADGVEYYVEVPGSQVGKDQFHTFNISASDGRDWATGKPNGTRTIQGPIVDDNLPPTSNVGDTLLIELQEDSGDSWLVLDDLFSDPNTIDEPLSYRIRNERGQWSLEYSDDNLTAKIVNNGTEEEPEFRLKISPEPDVNGMFSIRVNASDNEFFEKYAEVEVMLSIDPVNDPPKLKSIRSSTIQEFDEQFTYDVEQEELVEVWLRAEDIDGDDLQFHWDIEDVLSNPVNGENFDFNATTGDMWFIPGDADVGSFETMVQVSDGNGGKDEFTLVFYVDNINDPPTINVPKERSTIQGEYLYIIPKFHDPDLDSGDIITFSYDLGELGDHTPSSAVDFTQSTGRLVIEALSEDMIGEWEINITVVDFYGLADWGICRVTIGNVNDPPKAFDINIEQQNDNLTVMFHTTEAIDKDKGDVLTYIWDFGDGSDPLSGKDLTDVSHEFPNAGVYTVTLKVSDGMAFSEPKELIVTVTAPPQDPDQDNDGMDDQWELRFGLDPNDPDDALMDPDGDGMTNLEEFRYYEENGEYLNPRDPDTDRDGWMDGEEHERNFDPLDARVHPSDPNEDINLLLWVVAILFVFIAFVSVVLFLIMLIRNRRSSQAMPVAASPVPAPPEQFPEASYESIPPSTMEQLPSAPLEQDNVYPEQGYLGPGGQYDEMDEYGSDTNYQGTQNYDQNDTDQGDAGYLQDLEGMGSLGPMPHEHQQMEQDNESSPPWPDPAPMEQSPPEMEQGPDMPYQEPPQQEAPGTGSELPVEDVGADVVSGPAVDNGEKKKEDEKEDAKMPTLPELPDL